MTATLEARPLTRESFADFGDVIEAASDNAFTVNGGRARRHSDLARIELVGEGARPMISIFRSESIAVPFEVAMVERHPLGSQAFIPMEGQRFLVVVGPAGEPPGAGALRAFVTDGRQGVNYRAGVWHAVLAPLERGGDFLAVDRGGPGENCDELTLETPLLVVPAA